MDFSSRCFAHPNGMSHKSFHSREIPSGEYTCPAGLHMSVYLYQGSVPIQHAIQEMGRRILTDRANDGIRFDNKFRIWNGLYSKFSTAGTRQEIKTNTAKG